MQNNNSYLEYLKQENELTKLKIQAEFGFQLNDESKLNPAIENIWLKQILEYERAMVNSNQITLGEKLGNPVFKPYAEIPEDQMASALHEAMEVLQTKNIVLDSVAGAPDHELYKFITEELMNVEVDSISPPNMLTCFIYEEFHPNHEYDIRRHADDLIKSLERKETDYNFLLSKESDDEIHELRFENLKRRLKLFVEAFDKIAIKAYEVLSVHIAEELAEIEFNYNLSVTPHGSRIAHSIIGKGKMKLKLTFEWWSVVDIEMAGVV